MTYFDAKMIQVRLRLGLGPGPRWESLQRSSRSSTCISAGLLLR